MKKNLTFKSGFFTLRVVVAFVLCSVSAGFIALALATSIVAQNKATFGASGASAQWRAKVDTDVLAKAALGKTEFIINVTPAADLRGAKLLTTKEAKGRYVYETLTAAAEATQPAVRQMLHSLGAEYRSFWVSNVIWAKGNLTVIEALALMPQVASISPSSTGGLKLPPQPATTQSPNSPDATAAVEPNITKVNADDVWALGYLGQNVVIAGADTGVRWTHNLLKNHYRGWNGTSADHNYNWHDAIHNPNTGCPADSPEPCDDDSLLGGGHGSHTMGTMLGDDGGSNQTGMAPGAKWIACRNMNNGVGVVPTYLECMQWFIAPTNSAGANPDPSKAPHVINNSWGCLEPGCAPEPNPAPPGFMRATLQASRAAGIVYAVSAGNEGNNGTGDCSTIEFPLARYPESFTVGATSHVTDLIADFSSRGPVMGDNDYPPPAGLRKPNISAPGVGVRSAQRANDSAYGSLSGTSMAGPHVAGLVALVISANPTLAGNVDRIEEIIELSAVPKTTTQLCGDDTGAVPNNVYGWGRIDALAAVNLALADIGCPPAPFFDDFEPFPRAGWVVNTAVNTVPASLPWTAGLDATAHSPNNSYHTDASTLADKDDRLVAPPQDLSPTSHLIFWHRFNTEETYDGGVLEISVDGGGTWVDVTTGGNVFVAGGYNGVIDPDLGSLIAGQPAWTGPAVPMTTMTRVDVNLGVFAGTDRLIRWRYVGDPVAPLSVPGETWAIDDVEFTNLACALPAPIPNLVLSRKVHGGAGPFDIDLPLIGNPGIECRSGGATQVVLIFGTPVTFTGAAVTSGTGAVSSTSGNGTNQAIINLTGVTNAQTITVTLLGVSAGGASADIPVPIGVLNGDTTADRFVNSADISQTKSRSGQAVGASNFRSDVTVDGFLNSADISSVKSRSGTALP